MADRQPLRALGRPQAGAGGEAVLLLSPQLRHHHLGRLRQRPADRCAVGAGRRQCDVLGRLSLPGLQTEQRFHRGGADQRRRPRQDLQRQRPARPEAVGGAYQSSSRRLGPARSGRRLTADERGSGHPQHRRRRRGQCPADGRGGAGAGGQHRHALRRRQYPGGRQPGRPVGPQEDHAARVGGIPGRRRRHRPGAWRDTVHLGPRPVGPGLRRLVRPVLRAAARGGARAGGARQGGRGVARPAGPGRRRALPGRRLSRRPRLASGLSAGPGGERRGVVLVPQGRPRGTRIVGGALRWHRPRPGGVWPGGHALRCEQRRLGGMGERARAAAAGRGPPPAGRLRPLGMAHRRAGFSDPRLRRSRTTGRRARRYWLQHRRQCHGPAALALVAVRLSLQAVRGEPGRVAADRRLHCCRRYRRSAGGARCADAVAGAGRPARPGGSADGHVLRRRRRRTLSSWRRWSLPARG